MPIQKKKREYILGYRLGKFIKKRYGSEENLLMLEIGGQDFPVVPYSVDMENNHLIQIDVDEKSLDINRHLTKKIPNIDYIHASAQSSTMCESIPFEKGYDLPFKPNTIDNIFLLHFPMYGDDDASLKDFFSDLYRVLKKDGEIFVYPKLNRHKPLERIFYVKMYMISKMGLTNENLGTLDRRYLMILKKV
ncbi:MAG TPA: class I SAM-dependent methyltransferase [archaeon]|nr:class I SAM-dependent methyltransferase [archaeon]